MKAKKAKLLFRMTVFEIRFFEEALKTKSRFDDFMLACIYNKMEWEYKAKTKHVQRLIDCGYIKTVVA